MDIQLLARSFYEHSLYIRNRSPHTIREYRVVLNMYIKFSQVTAIEEVTEKSLKEFFLDGRVNKAWKPYTYIGFYWVLNVFLKWCVTNRYLPTNPLADIELPKPEKRLPAKLKKQDALKILDVVYNYPYGNTYLRNRNHAIFSMFIFAGLRKSELLQLRLSDVDVPGLTIFVNQGKGSKDRIIPMSYTLAQSLSRYLKERERVGKTCPEFFASLSLNMGITHSGLKRIVEKVTRVSGIRFTLHKLRHTFATLMLEGGCDIYSLSRMMGHSDIKTTTIYLSASAEHLRSQVSKHPLNDLVRVQ